MCGRTTNVYLDVQHFDDIRPSQAAVERVLSGADEAVVAIIERCEA